jgi:hypothetical protein
MTDNDALQSDDMAADVAAAVRSLSDAPAERVEAEHEAVEDAAQQVSKQLEEPAEAARQVRDGRGRFAKADTTADVQNNGARAETHETHRRREFPAYTNGWNPQAKLDLDGATPALRAAIEQREHEVSEGIRQYSERLKEVEDLIAPRWAELQSAGYQRPAQYLGQLVQVHEALLRDGVGTLVQLAQSLTPENQARLRQHFGGSSQQWQPSAEEIQVIKSHIAQEVQKGIADGLRQERQAQARIAQKQRASGASLNGAPHGAQSAPPPRKSNGHFNSVADDVLAAVNALR